MKSNLVVVEIMRLVDMIMQHLTKEPGRSPCWTNFKSLAVNHKHRQIILCCSHFTNIAEYVSDNDYIEMLERLSYQTWLCDFLSFFHEIVSSHFKQAWLKTHQLNETKTMSKVIPVAPTW